MRDDAPLPRSDGLASNDYDDMPDHLEAVETGVEGLQRLVGADLQRQRVSLASLVEVFVSGSDPGPPLQCEQRAIPCSSAWSLSTVSVSGRISCV